LFQNDSRQLPFRQFIGCRQSRRSSTDDDGLALRGMFFLHHCDLPYHPLLRCRRYMEEMTTDGMMTDSSQATGWLVMACVGATSLPFGTENCSRRIDSLVRYIGNRANGEVGKQ